ncbi:MAG: hypothetical protein ACR2J0_07235 [Mycobacteriales bacterium]
MATYPVSKGAQPQRRGVADAVPAGDGSLHLFGDAAHREDSEQNEEYGRACVQEPPVQLFGPDVPEARDDECDSRQTCAQKGQPHSPGPRCNHRYDRNREAGL